jgi:hypothetical protein
VISHPAALERLSLTDLESACSRETRRYRTGQPSDSQFCSEIFRRALLQVAADPVSAAPAYADEDARTALVRIYTDFIKANINRTAVHTTSLDDLVQQVWSRFWSAANQGLSFLSLEAALSYLKRVTITTVIEERRRERVRQRDESLQQIIAATGEHALADPGVDLFEEHAQRRFRQRCREVLTDALEYRVFWMRYSMALPPRQIASVLSRENVRINGRTTTPRAVSDLLERSCRRLRNDAEIQELLRAD